MLMSRLAYAFVGHFVASSRQRLHLRDGRAAALKGLEAALKARIFPTYLGMLAAAIAGSNQADNLRRQTFVLIRVSLEEHSR